MVAGDSGKNPDVFSDIIGDAENGELLLAEAENWFENGRVERESVGISGSYLDPHRRA